LVAAYWFNARSNTLVLRKLTSGANSRASTLEWVGLTTARREKIWEGDDFYTCAFDEAGKQLAFSDGWRPDQRLAPAICGDTVKVPPRNNSLSMALQGIDTSLVLAAESPVFSKDGSKLFFTFTKHYSPMPPDIGVQVNIWGCRDKRMPEEQLMALRQRRKYTGALDLQDGKPMQLENEDLLLTENFNVGEHSNYVLGYRKRWTGFPGGRESKIYRLPGVH